MKLARFNNKLKYHTKYSYKPLKKFGGYTECFSKLMINLKND